MSLNVLHVLNYSIPNLSGYTIRSKYLIESEAGLGLRPFVITSPKYEHEKPFISGTTISGIEYLRTRPRPFPVKAPFLDEMLYIKNFRGYVSEAVKDKDIDVIHAHSPSLNGLASLALKRRGKKVPLIYHVRALWEDAGVESGKMKMNSLKYMASSRMETFLLKRSDFIIVICEGLKKILMERGLPAEKIGIIENGVDTDFFRPRARDARLVEKYGLEGSCVAGFIGSFFRFEGVIGLVKSFAMARNGKLPLKLLLVGGGEDFELVKGLVREAGLEKDVMLTGVVPHNEILDYYSVMDILVYPRLSTRLTEFVTPLKPLEAMSMGKAVIGSDVGGIKELVKDKKTGVLFPAGDEMKLAHAISALAMDTEFRISLGDTAKEDVRRNRGWKSIAAKMPAIYERLSGKI